MLNASGLFVELELDETHAHIAKLKGVWKICVGRPNWEMDIIRLQVFSISLNDNVSV